MTSLPRALLLDLDDTILDISGSADVCWRTLCAECAPSLGLGAELLTEEIVRARNAFWRDPARLNRWHLDVNGATAHILTEVFETLGLANTAAASDLAEVFRNRRNDFLEPFPGALDAVAQLHATGTRLALLTNGATVWQRAKIERYALAQHFECILIEEEFGVGKPDERIFKAALEALGVKPSEAWMVGDNLEWDVAGAQRVGVHGIWMDHRSKGLAEDSPIKPDRIISRLSDLVPIATAHR